MLYIRVSSPSYPINHTQYQCVIYRVECDDWNKIKKMIEILFCFLFSCDYNQVIVAGYSVTVARRLKAKLHQVKTLPYLICFTTAFSHDQRQWLLYMMTLQMRSGLHDVAGALERFVETLGDTAETETEHDDVGY